MQKISKKGDIQITVLLASFDLTQHSPLCQLTTAVTPMSPLQLSL